MGKVGGKVGALERQLNVKTSDPFEGAVFKDLGPLFDGSRDVSQAPRRVENMLLYVALWDLHVSLRAAAQPDATPDEVIEGARARAEWSLASEGPVDLVLIARRERLTDVLCKRLADELAHPRHRDEWIDDPDAPSGLPLRGPDPDAPQEATDGPLYVPR
jgi:hypothetical protein